MQFICVPIQTQGMLESPGVCWGELRSGVQSAFRRALDPENLSWGFLMTYGDCKGPHLGDSLRTGLGISELTHRKLWGQPRLVTAEMYNGLVVDVSGSNWDRACA